MHQLYFVPKVIINRNGTKRVVQADTEVKLQLMVRALEDMIQESSLADIQRDYMHDAIEALNHALFYFSDPGDNLGEPPITLDEMHTTAWQQHQAMHS